MSAATRTNLISVDDYLAGELVSPVKHDFVGGIVYARVDTRNVHNQIAGNILAAFHGRLRGRSCRPYNSDTKIRVRLPYHVRFYYPDATVVCRENDPRESFQDEPAVIAEVLSQSTRRIDEGEKKDSYLSIPSLGAYLLVEQELPLVIAFRRTETGFVREIHDGMTAVIPLPEIGIELPLAEIYEGVEFVPETRDDSDA